MDVTERMGTIGAARDEAARAIKHARWHGRWPEGVSAEAQEILARDPVALALAQNWARTERQVKSIEAFGERHDWRTANTAWARANRRLAGLFGKGDEQP